MPGLLAQVPPSSLKKNWFSNPHDDGVQGPRPVQPKLPLVSPVDRLGNLVAAREVADRKEEGDDKSEREEPPLGTVPVVIDYYSPTVSRSASG